MAKRDPEIEPIDEELPEADIPTVGERLRVAREEKGLSLEDVAAQTRIPLRHLASIEIGDWDNLPAPTYTIGFAKNYASAVDLDRAEIGIQLREEMGGQRFASTSADVFEPADPARTMPKTLVIGAIVAVVVLIAVMSWLNSRSLNSNDQPQAEPAASAPAVASPQPGTPSPPPAAARQGTVVLAANAPVWLQVSEKGGASLFSGMLQPGQTYTVPASAVAPVLKTGKPEALRVTVGNSVAPPLGPPAATVADVSLLPADLMRAPAASPPQPAASPPPPRKSRRRLPAATATPAAPAETPPPATNTAQ